MDKLSKNTFTPVEREEAQEDPNAPKVGRWYWVKGTSYGYNEAGDRVEKPSRWLGCATHVGSNFVEITSHKGGHDRVHFNEFDDTCEHEPNAEAYINERILEEQGHVKRLMGEVQALTAQLALSMGPPQLDASNETRALVVSSGGREISEYKGALVLAKEKTLPDLFKTIENHNETMGRWMAAPLLPLRAEVTAMKPVIKAIEGRIFNVELYAGLTEQVVQIADGKPAGLNEKIYLFQRRAYMDEECLANYETGGMKFENIDQFDAWMAKPANLDRLLPKQRCVVAFQVRRHRHEARVTKVSQFIQLLFDSISGQNPDTLTFLYMRNGEKVYRLATAIEFGEKLFPDIDKQQLLTGQIYAENHGSKLITQWEYDQMVTEEREEEEKRDREYQEELATYPARLKKYEEDMVEYRGAIAAGAEPYDRWCKKDGLREPKKPHEPWKHGVSHEAYRYSAWNKENVYYDDIAKAVQGEMERHNRLVLVLQGLLDRSPVMHPHPAWQIWTPDGFTAALELIYDSDRALVPGVAPDFEAYRAKLNESITAGTITVGQQEAWLRHMAELKNEKVAADDGTNVLTHYMPYGNPGPGAVARVERVGKRSGKCTFRWKRKRSGRLTRRDRQWRGKSYKDQFDCSFTASPEQLFNVDAYKPGDFKQFFADPRTRADYIRWAPLLLIAEEYHAGNRKLAGEEEEDEDP